MYFLQSIHLLSLCALKHAFYSPIAFDERVTFGFSVSGYSLVPVRLLYYLRVRLMTITQSHTDTMHQMHMHKAVTERIEAKKLLSRQGQSDYRVV